MLARGANHMSLVEAQRIHDRGGNKEEGRRDEQWRPIDLAVDDFETLEDASAPWPADRTTLYWWRTGFWRKHGLRDA